MFHSRSSEEDGEQDLLFQDPIELSFREKIPQSTALPCLFYDFTSFCNTRRLVISMVITFITVGILTVSIFILHSRSLSNILTNHCGSATEEAIALGCKFDAINFSWQPAECFDEEIYNRYWKKSQEQGVLRFYADSNFTKELPQDPQLLMHIPNVWSDHPLHVLHCMYSWELMHHALTLNKPVVEFVSFFNHTMHCSDTALDENWRVHDTSIRASHNRCIMLS